MRKRHVWSCGHERFYEARNNRVVRHDQPCQACSKRLVIVVQEGLPRVFRALAELEVTIASCIAQRRGLDRPVGAWRGVGR